MRVDVFPVKIIAMGEIILCWIYDAYEIPFKQC